jgi:hypothetical protein
MCAICGNIRLLKVPKIELDEIDICGKQKAVIRWF